MLYLSSTEILLNTRLPYTLITIKSSSNSLVNSPVALKVTKMMFNAKHSVSVIYAFRVGFAMTKKNGKVGKSSTFHRHLC